MSPQGGYYDDGDRLYVDANSVDECAAACTRKYSSDSRFVGFDYTPKKWEHCECLIDWHMSGAILRTGIGEDDSCVDQFCYSFTNGSKNVPHLTMFSLAISLSLGIFVMFIA